MDFTAFKLSLEASRSFEATVDGATFKLRVPTDHAWRNALEGNRDEHGRLLESIAMRVVLDAAVTGWDGVTQRHLLQDAGDEAVPFSPEARALLLDTRQDLADLLSVELANRIATRRAAREDALKNFSRASSGN